MNVKGTTRGVFCTEEERTELITLTHSFIHIKAPYIFFFFFLFFLLMVMQRYPIRFIRYYALMAVTVLFATIIKLSPLIKSLNNSGCSTKFASASSGFLPE